MEDEKEQLLASLRRKEAENGILQLTIKEYKRKWSACEGKMKSMEELWTKQIDALQKSLSAAKAVVEERCSWQDQDTEGDNSSVHLSSHESVERNTADRRESDARRSVLDPSRSVLGQLSKELEHRTEVFNDDARFLVEVKSGQIEANFKPEAELQRLKLRFEKWKKDFKDRLRETKNMLKKLARSEPTEKKRKKKWWGRW
jgi:myosin-5